MPRNREWKPGRRDRRVLLVLLTGAGRLSGYPISRAAMAGAGGVYISLARLESRGWVTRQQEADPPGGRPPRYFYQLTRGGRAMALSALGLEDGASDG